MSAFIHVLPHPPLPGAVCPLHAQQSSSGWVWGHFEQVRLVHLVQVGMGDLEQVRVGHPVQVRGIYLVQVIEIILVCVPA